MERVGTTRFDGSKERILCYFMRVDQVEGGENGVRGGSSVSLENFCMYSGQVLGDEFGV